MLYIFYKPSDLWNYMLRPVRGGGVGNQSIELIDLDAFPRARKIRKIALSFGIGENSYFPKSLQEILGKIRGSDRFLMLGWPSNDEMKLFAKSIPAETKKFFWIWNSLATEPHAEKMRERMNVIQRAGFEISTFEDDDVKKFGLVKLNQFFRVPGENELGEETVPATDFYFLGKSKGRERQLSAIEKLVSKLGLRTDFHVIGKGATEISYKENLLRVAGTRCLVEVVQERQTGLSLRALEALFFGKKLLTTNLVVRDAEFFRKENIFILENASEHGNDTATRLREFLETPSVEIPNSVKEKYSFRTWLSHFTD